MTPERTQTLALIQTLHEACEHYEALPEKQPSMSAHAVLDYATKEKVIQDSLSEILRLFNTQTPPHWPALKMEALFNRNQCVTIRPKEDDIPNSQDQYKGRRIQGPAFARLMGIFYAAIDLTNTAPDPKHAKRWNETRLPEAFKKPEYILFYGQSGRLLYRTTGFHDLIGQTVITFENWCFNTMMTGSRRKNLEQSFQDGMTWHDKNFHKYQNNTWTAGPHFLNRIKKTKLVSLELQKRMEKAAYESQQDQALLSIITLLEKVDTTLPQAEYAVFTTTQLRGTRGFYYKAHDPSHALAQALAENVEYNINQSTAKKYNPAHWPVFSLTQAENTYPA